MSYVWSIICSLTQGSGVAAGATITVSFFLQKMQCNKANEAHCGTQFECWFKNAQRRLWSQSWWFDPKLSSVHIQP